MPLLLVLQEDYLTLTKHQQLYLYTFIYTSKTKFSPIDNSDI